MSTSSTKNNINGIIVPYENKSKYLDMTLDVNHRWKTYIESKITNLVAI